MNLIITDHMCWLSNAFTGMTYLHDMQLQSKISIRANGMLHILSLPSLNMESSVRIIEGLYLHAALGLSGISFQTQTYTT